MISSNTLNLNLDDIFYHSAYADDIYQILCHPETSFNNKASTIYIDYKVNTDILEYNHSILRGHISPCFFSIYSERHLSMEFVFRKDYIIDGVLQENLEILKNQPILDDIFRIAKQFKLFLPEMYLNYDIL